MQPERDGRDKYLSGMSIHSAILFQPAVGYHTPYHGDLIGKLYAPLIYLDRKYFHQTRYLTDDGTWEWIQSLPKEEIHPSQRQNSPRAGNLKLAEPEFSRGGHVVAIDYPITLTGGKLVFIPRQNVAERFWNKLTDFVIGLD